MVDGAFLPSHTLQRPAGARRRRLAGRDRLARARGALPPAAVALGALGAAAGPHGDAGDQQLAHLLRRAAPAAARFPGEHARLGVRPRLPGLLHRAGVRGGARPAAPQGGPAPTAWPATTRRCAGWWPPPGERGYAVRAPDFGGDHDRPRAEVDDGRESIAMPVRLDDRVVASINLTWRRQVLSLTGIVQRHLGDLHDRRPHGRGARARRRTGRQVGPGLTVDRFPPGPALGASDRDGECVAIEPRRHARLRRGRKVACAPSPTPSPAARRPAAHRPRRPRTRARRGPRPPRPLRGEPDRLEVPHATPSPARAGRSRARTARAPSRPSAQGVDPVLIGERVWIWEAAYQRPHGHGRRVHRRPGARRRCRCRTRASFELGAALGIPFLTAHRCLTVAETRPGPARRRARCRSHGAGAGRCGRGRQRRHPAGPLGGARRSSAR